MEFKSNSTTVIGAEFLTKLIEKTNVGVRRFEELLMNDTVNHLLGRVTNNLYLILL